MKISKLIGFIIGITFVLGVYIQDSGANTGGSLSLPVNIEFAIENTPRVNEEISIKIRVVLLENMHADIGCILPNGVHLVGGPEVRLRSYSDQRPYAEQDAYRLNAEAIELWVGPLLAGEVKEFTVRMIISSEGHHDLVVIVEDLEKAAVKEVIIGVDVIN